MSHRATIRDVAKAAGVSTTTVSRYLNKAGYVGADALIRIEEAIKGTDYAPSIMARGLKSLKSSLIVLIVPDICNPFYSKMAKTVQRLAQQSGFGLVLLDSEEQAEKEAEGVLFAAQMYAAGIMVASINSCAHVAPLIREHKLAAVGLSSYDIPEAFDLVTVHKTGGTNLAVEHLVELGHRDIVFAGGRPSSGIATGRREGFERQMRRMDLPLTADSIFETGFSQEDGYRAGLRFVKRQVRPTAICCANDLIAFGVVNALSDSGLDVPGDVSITGMDDVPYASLSKPRLTTVTNDGALFAERAFEMLLTRITGSEAPFSHFEVPNVLILRESTAPPAPVSVSR